MSYRSFEESGRPPIEKALEKVSTKYELVHAAAQRVKQLLNEGKDFLQYDVRTGQIKKLTFKAIEDIAEGKVRVLSLKALFKE